MKTACRIVFTVLFCLSVLFMMPCPALASPSLIQYLTITDSSGRMLPGYSFDTNCDTYYLYFDHPQTLNFWARAYPDACMIDSDHSKVKEISFQQQISKEHTVVYISAVAEESQTVVFHLYLEELPDEDESSRQNSATGSDTGGEQPDDTLDEYAGDLADISCRESFFDQRYAGESYGYDDYYAGDSNCAAAQDPLYIVLQIGSSTALVDEHEYLLDAAPYLVSPGYTYVPLRFVAEAMGAQVSWDGSQQRVDISLNERSFSLFIGQTIAGTSVSARITNSRTFVPLRYVAETLGATVNWQYEGKYIFISK